MRFLIGLIFILAVFLLLYIHFDITSAKKLSTPSEIPSAPTALRPVNHTTVEPTRNIYGDGCGDLADATFQSVRRYETGLGPDNREVMGYWTLQFQNTKNGDQIDPPLFSWRHSDVIESGTYICKFNTITLKFNYDSLVATYNPTTHILRWQDIEYKRIK